jgi:hypothetical protein
MSRTPFDEFAKQLLEQLLSPLGEVNTSREVPGESRWVDVWFSPAARSPGASTSLGLLGQMATTPCLFEPFRNPVTAPEVRSCLLKLLALQAELERQARRDHQGLTTAQLWILTPTASRGLLGKFSAIPGSKWSAGVYELAAGLQTLIVVIHQLPVTPETLWLRLLGRGKVQQQAIDEVLGLAKTDARRDGALQLLVSWKMMIESGQITEEAEVLMSLSQAYVEWEQKTAQRVERSLILRLLTRKVGSIAPDVRSQIEALPSAKLEELGEALLDFAEVTDLVSWLDSDAERV